MVGSSLYSYFHKTPWPADFNLILVCMVIYYVSSYTWWFLKKYANIEYFKWYRTSFNHDSKQGPALDDELSKFVSKHSSQLENAMLKVGSKAELYSENYNLSIEVVLKDKKVLRVASSDAEQERHELRQVRRHRGQHLQREDQRALQSARVGGLEIHKLTSVTRSRRLDYNSN